LKNEFAAYSVLSSGMFTAKHLLEKTKSLTKQVDFISKLCIFPDINFGKQVLAETIIPLLELHHAFALCDFRISKTKNLVNLKTYRAI
jgi:hypothetical protein